MFGTKNKILVQIQPQKFFSRLEVTVSQIGYRAYYFNTDEFKESKLNIFKTNKKNDIVLNIFKTNNENANGIKYI